MDSDGDPDLEAFKSNLCRILERKLGKAAALLSNLCPNASDPQSIGVEEQYLPTVPVPVHCMESFYYSAAEPDRELLKLPILGYVQPSGEKLQGSAGWAAAVRVTAAEILLLLR